MKNVLFLLGFSCLFLFACDDATDESDARTSKTELQENPEDLIERMPGIYREFYPGKKQLKIAGPVDGDDKRHGTWESYYENGQMNSMTYFSHGIKEGHSIVYHPNGAIHYVGEYKNDQKIGLWKTYNEQAELISEDEF
jgi:antitoxin component YwqK of YwqJK toxin-antitoxin module